MITKTSEYALRMMIVLATENRIMNVHEIIEDIEVPEKYARKILLRLIKRNVLISIRGVEGGYSLAREPEHITLFDIFDALNEPILAEPPMENMIELSVFANALIYSEARYVMDNYTLAQIVKFNQRNLVSRSGEPIKLKKNKVTYKDFDNALEKTEGTILPLHPQHRELLAD